MDNIQGMVLAEKWYRAIKEEEDWEGIGCTGLVMFLRDRGEKEGEEKGEEKKRRRKVGKRVWRD